jgi:hypothetical protein
MRRDKRARAMDAYAGFAGHATVNAVMGNIPDELISTLTGKQLGLVMQAVAKSYAAGVRSQKPIEKIDDCLWIDGENKLIPIAALRQVTEKKDERGTTYAMSYFEPRPY